MAPDDFETEDTEPQIRPIRDTQTGLESPDLGVASGEIDVSGVLEEKHEEPVEVSEDSTVESEIPVEHVTDGSLSGKVEEAEEAEEAEEEENEFDDGAEGWKPVSSTAPAPVILESSEEFLEELSEEFSEEDLEKASQQGEIPKGVMEEEPKISFPYSQLLMEKKDYGTPGNPVVYSHLEIGEKGEKVEEELREALRKVPEKKPETPSKIMDWLRRRSLVVSLITVGVVATSAIGYGTYKDCGADDGKSKKPTAGEKLAHKKGADAGVRTFQDIEEALDAGIAVKMDAASKDIQDARPIPDAKTVPDASVTKQPIKVAVKSPPKSPKKVPSLKVKSAAKQEAGLMNIDSGSLDDLPEGKFKRMFNGEPVPVEDMPGGIISRYMEENLLEGASRAEKRAYKKHLKKLEKGWLMYMKHIESKVERKLSSGKHVSEKDMAEYEWFKNVYSKSNKKRYRQAGWMFDKYQKLKDKKSTKAKWYKKVFKMGKGFMQGLHKLNPHIKSFNAVEPGTKVSLSKKTGKVMQVLGTIVNWAKSMGKKTPKEAVITGEIQVDSPNVMFAANQSIPEVVQDTRSVIVEDIEADEETAESLVQGIIKDVKEKSDVDNYYAEYEVKKPEDESDVGNYYAEYEVEEEDYYAEYEVKKPIIMLNTK